MNLPIISNSGITKTEGSNEHFLIRPGSFNLAQRLMIAHGLFGQDWLRLATPIGDYPRLTPREDHDVEWYGYTNSDGARLSEPQTKLDLIEKMHMFHPDYLLPVWNFALPNNKMRALAIKKSSFSPKELKQLGAKARELIDKLGAGHERAAGYIANLFPGQLGELMMGRLSQEFSLQCIDALTEIGGKIEGKTFPNVHETEIRGYHEPDEEDHGIYLGGFHVKHPTDPEDNIYFILRNTRKDAAFCRNLEKGRKVCITEDLYGCNTRWYHEGRLAQVLD
jgi:hypothetical protein